MTKSISTLTSDINNLFAEKREKFGGMEEVVAGFRNFMSNTFEKGDEDPLKRPGLRFSNIGVPCERDLWYRINKPNSGEKFEAATLFKFALGHLLELLVISLAKESGHTVTGEGNSFEVRGIKGHRDCVIDGMTVDVKTASSFSFAKFKKGLTPENDAFGYLKQLRGYVHAAKDDPLVTYKRKGAFLVIDKQHGHMHLDIHEFAQHELDDVPYDIERKKAIVDDKLLPRRGFSDKEDGKSGNRMLDTNCSYCAFKHECWPRLRTFMYSGRPRFLTNVAKVPNVPEKG